MLSVTLFIIMYGPIISSVVMLSVASLIDMPIVVMLSVIVLCVLAHFKKRWIVGLLATVSINSI
jgi:hypothetical protein